MPQVYLIGIGMGNPDTLTLRGYHLIQDSDALVGAARMLDSTAENIQLKAGVKTLPSIKNEEIIEFISQQEETSIVSVLLSGDVGFFSAAKKLGVMIHEKLPAVSLEYVSGIGSLQYFCAKLETSWDDVKVVSVHGREASVPSAVRKFGKVFALTGSNKPAHAVCQELCEQGLAHAQVWVGEKLSYPEEKISHGTAKELSEQEFASLAVMLIEAEPVPARPYPAIGLCDEEFLRNTEGKTVPMTKQEIRAVALSSLKITEDACVYDIGAGTGSVTVEAAFLARGGRVFAVEKNPQAVAQMKENIVHFGLGNVSVVEGLAPEAMLPLPAPDFVFIGGSSGNLEEILNICFDKNPAVRIVVTAITLETVSDVLNSVKSMRKALSVQGETISLQISQVSAARSREVGGGSMHLMMGQNPVFVCTLCREAVREEQ